MLDPKTMKCTFIDACFGTRHLPFGFDDHDTLWTSGGGPVVGWRDTKVFEEAGDAQKAQGWNALGSTPAATASATPMSSRRVVIFV